MKHYHLIAVNGNPPFDLVKFHTFLTTELYPTYISGWWHYLTGPIYLVESNLNANQLYDLLEKHMNKTHFLIIRIDPSDTQGWLVKDAWKWMGRE
jgi:hypothetical protein